MAVPRTPIIAALLNFAAGLRFKTLFFVAAGLFLLDLLVPDLVPFADELILGVLTLLFGAWKRKKQPSDSSTRGRTIEGEVVKEVPRKSGR